MIAKLVDPNRGLHWDVVVETVEFALNNTVQRGINQHPSNMLFVVEQKGNISDTLQENLNELQEIQTTRDLEIIRAEAIACQNKLQDYNKQAVDAKRQAPHCYKENDLVMINNFDTHIGISKKLIPKFKGPYRVSKVLQNDRYIIEDVEGFQQSRVPYKRIWAIANMKPWIGNS